MLDKLRSIKHWLTGLLRWLVLKVALLLPQSHKQNAWGNFIAALFRLGGLRIKSPVFIDKRFKCINPENINMGSYVSLGHDNHFWAFSPIIIGRFTQTAKDLLIISGSHDVATLAPTGNQAVTIGAGCWIGARVTILGGVKVGNGVIIGACSLVNKDVPDFAIVGGNPAKIIRFRTPEEIQWNPFQSFSLNEINQDIHNNTVL